ncbi:MAG: LutC/YkgG family protein [Streptosporangiaceae bacterium]
MTLTERFAAELAEVDGEAHLVDSREQALAEVRTLVGDAPVVIDHDPDLEGAAEGLKVVDDPWQAELGLTSAVAAVAETGTLALVCDRDRARSTSLVPPVHVALVSQGRLVATFADAVDRLAGLRPTPSGMYFITGPSHSGDIELTLVRGVHGPREVHVILYAI